MKMNFANMMLVMAALVTFTACSSDDADGAYDDKNAGSNNTWDVAVTGALQEAGIQRAVLTGYVNLNLMEPVPYDCQCGIQYGPTFWDDYDPASSSWGYKAYATTWDGRKMTITLSNLEPNQEWNFRTFVYADGKYYYGETKKFVTPKFPNIFTVTVTSLTKDAATFTCKINTDGQSWLEDVTGVKVGFAYSLNKASLSGRTWTNDYPYHNVDYYMVNYYMDDYNANYIELNEDNSFTYTLYHGELASGTTVYYCPFTAVEYLYYAVGEIKSYKVP